MIINVSIHWLLNSYILKIFYAKIGAINAISKTY